MFFTHFWRLCAALRLRRTHVLMASAFGYICAHCVSINFCPLKLCRLYRQTRPHSACVKLLIISWMDLVHSSNILHFINPLRPPLPPRILKWHKLVIFLCKRALAIISFMAFINHSTLSVHFEWLRWLKNFHQLAFFSVFSLSRSPVISLIYVRHEAHHLHSSASATAKMAVRTSADIWGDQQWCRMPSALKRERIRWIVCIHILNARATYKTEHRLKLVHCRQPQCAKVPLIF